MSPLTLAPPATTHDAAVETRLQRLLEEELHLDVASPEADLFATAGLDSLAFVQMLVRIEEIFGRRIPLEELELDDLKSVRRISRLLATGARPA